MDGMDIDDYSRERSPIRERSRSPPRQNRDRDYESRERNDRNGRNDGRRRRERNFGSRRDYSASESEDTRNRGERNYDNSVFIGNIPFEATPRDVEDIFGGQFKIVRADIVTHRGRSRGMATVEFTSKEDVKEAIAKYDRYSFRGRDIFVRQDYPPPDKHHRRPNLATSSSSSKGSSEPALTPDGYEVFVGNLPFSINWQALKDLMREAGEVTRADVRTDPWGKSRGFGTVFFRTASEAQRAVDMFQGYDLEGRRMDARHGRGSSSNGNAANSGGRSELKKDAPRNKNSPFTEGVSADGPRSDTIYVSNLPYVTSNDDLYELFETVGRTSNAEIQYNVQGKPNGCAVVQFELVDLAENAIKNLDDYLYGGRNLKISYAKRA